MDIFSGMILFIPEIVHTIKIKAKWGGGGVIPYVKWGEGKGVVSYVNAT